MKPPSSAPGCPPLRIRGGAQFVRNSHQDQATKVRNPLSVFAGSACSHPLAPMPCPHPALPRHSLPNPNTDVLDASATSQMTTYVTITFTISLLRRCWPENAHAHAQERSSAPSLCHTQKRHVAVVLQLSKVQYSTSQDHMSSLIGFLPEHGTPPCLFLCVVPLPLSMGHHQSVIG